MASNEIRSRFIFETKQAEKNVQNLEKGFSKFLGLNLKLTDSVGNLKNILGKFTAGIGLAMTAGEAWNKMLSSNRSLGDEVGRSMTAVNVSIDSFFASLTSGDFSSFFRGLDGTISRARELYDAIDKLSVFNLFNSANMAEIQKNIAQQRVIVKDINKPEAERKAAQEELKRLNEELVKQAEQHASLANSAYTKSLSASLGRAGYTEETAKQFYDKYENFETASERLAELEKKANELSLKRSMSLSMGANSITGARLPEVEKHTLLNKDEYKEWEKLNAAINFNPGELEKAFAYRVEALNAQREVYMIQSEMLESINRDVSTKPSGGKTGITTKPTKKEVEVTPVLNLEGFENQLNQMVSVEDMWKGDEQTYWSRINQIGDIDTEKLHDLNVELGKTFEELDTAKVEKYNAAFQAVGQSVSTVASSLSGMMSNDVAGWFLSSIGSVAQMVVQLQALATAQGVASAAKLPFPANLVAIATVVATIANVFSSLPKFAEGGVVGGQNYQDGILARVSSGEMVMTEAQQRKILDLVSSGGGETPVSGGGKVRVTGEELVMCINNFGRRSGKGTIQWG